MTNSRQEQLELEAQYWSSVTDPSQIERGQVEALHLARQATSMVKPSWISDAGLQPQSYLTNYMGTSTTTACHVLQTVFISDDEMQTAGSPTDNQEEQVVTLVDPRGPLNSVYMQPTPRMDDNLDVEPSRSPRDPVNTTGEMLDNYFDENLMDVLKVSGLASNFSAYCKV